MIVFLFFIRFLTTQVQQSDIISSIIGGTGQGRELVSIGAQVSVEEEVKCEE